KCCSNFLIHLFNDLYIQYYNDFLSVDAFARYHGLSIEDMQKLIDLGRHVNHNSLWKEDK
uniref:hypothetical protein n=1 Tax=Acinetobacter seifertii TaxID=1530123 RepID=UPI00124C31BF